MAARGNTRDLFLQVDGTVAPLQAVLKSGKTALVEFAGDARKQLEAVETSLRDLAADPAGAATQMTANYTNAFKEIRRNAQNVLSADSGAGALNVLSANTAREAATAAENRAAAIRVVAQAAREEATAQGSTNAALVAYAASAMAADREATDYAISLREQANALTAVEGRMGAIVPAGKRITEVSGQARAGMQQLSFQLGDVATQLAAGTPPSIVFAQQIGQVTQAIGLMTGETKGFLGFIGGPWGMALSSALVMLTPFVSKLWEGDEASEKLKGSTLSLVDALSKEKFGTDEARKALDAYNDAQKRADTQTMLSKRIALDRADADLKAAQATREKIKAQLEWANANPESGMAGAAASAALDRNEADIKRIEETRQNLRGEVGENVARRQSDPEFAITERFKEQREVLARQLDERKASTAEITRQNKLLNDREKSELKTLRESNAAEKAGDRDVAAGKLTPARVGKLLQDQFGGTITSTNDGKHVKGSYHYRNQAVDFVPRGGVGAVSKDEIRAFLAAQGVSLQELLGPGDKDHNDHFHVAFAKTRRSPESVGQRAESAEEREASRRQAFEGQLRTAQDAYYRAQMVLLDGVEERADVEIERLDAARKQRDAELNQQVAAKKLTSAEAAQLRSLNDKTTELQKQAATERENARLLRQRQQVLDYLLDRDLAELRGRSEILNLQGQLAGTLEQRRQIALQLLEADLEERRKIARRKIATEGGSREAALTRIEGRRELATIDAQEPYLRKAHERDFAKPFDRYKQELREVTADSNTALESIAVRGLQGLEDQLGETIGKVFGLKGAFGDLVTSVLVDIAKLELKKNILSLLDTGSVFGVKLFGGSRLPGKATGHIPGYAEGLIQGPGTGTSDSILAYLEGAGLIRVSAGELIMTAEATRQFAPMLKAMNAGTLPGYATGLVPKIPQIPSARAAANDLHAPRQDRVQVDAKFHVSASPEFDARMERVSVRTVGAAAEPIMAGAQARTTKAMSRPRLPGGFS